MYRKASSVSFLFAVLCGFSIPLQAQTFAPIPALSFTRVFAGANPLPQTITPTSVGAAFDFRVTLSTASGGSWLAVTGCGSYCNTPQALTVTVNPTAALAVGTYTGQVVLTEYYGRTSITIPVTLTIAPAGGAYLDNLPGQVSFTLKTGGSTPPSQSFQIRNGGSGTLNWTLTASTADGGNWLSVPATNGVAPSVVTVSLLKQNLPNAGQIAGTFTGRLSIQTSTGNTTVPVSVKVGNDGFSQINAISFTKLYAGADPLPQVLTAASTGSVFDFRVTSSTANGGDWLTVTGCGSYCNTTQALIATVAPSPSLAAGTYTGQIVLTEYYGSHSITVPVTLTVASAGTSFFSDVPGHMSFSMQTLNVPGALPPPNQVLQIRNAGSGALNWTLTTSTADGGAWLNVSAANGVAPSLVSVAVATQNLPNAGLVAGTFVGQLVFQTTGNSVTVPVSVVVGPTSFRQVNAINFTKLFGGANSLPQTIPIATHVTAFDFRVAAYTATGGDWLTISGCGSYCNTPQSIIATVNPSASLAAGIYTGEIVFTEYYSSMAMTVPVTLTVAASTGPFFDDLPGQLSFNIATGSGNPLAQTVQIRNGGTGALDWSVTTSTSDGGNWLNVSGTSGVAPSNVTVNVVASALPNAGLVAGAFNGELVFRSTASNSSVTIPVSVAVGAAVFSPSAGSLTFSKPFGGSNPLPQTISIASTGTNFDMRVVANTGNGGAWLTVSGCGSYCNTPQTITATVNPNASLAAGTYTGQLVFTEYYNSMALTVPVTLTVGTVQNSPAVVSINPATGSGASQTFTATYGDANGGSDINVVYFLMNTSAAGNSACFVEYNRATNAFRLMDDAGATWSATMPPGSGSLANSQCTLTGGGTSAAIAGNNLTVTLNLSFQPAFAGLKNLYGLAIDSANNNTGWAGSGSWTVTGGGPPGLVSLAPLSGSGTSGTFTAVFRHPGGPTQHYLGYVLFLPTPNIVWFTALGSCLVEYNRISNGMRLIDNAGTGWLGPPQGVPVAPGTAPLSNNACTVNVAAATATLSGTDMTVTIPMTFKAAGLTQVVGTFTQSLDVNGVWTDMRQFGSWQIPGAPVKPGPATGPLTRTPAAGLSTVVTATASHTAGTAQIGLFHVLIADRIVGGAACQVIYFAFENTVALINDAGTDLVGAGRVPLGSANTLANSRCSLNVAAATRSTSGNNVIVTYPLTFTQAFAGAKNIYMNTFDLSGNLSHWVQGATFTVQ